ncbi:MAG: tetratricopeptide (TPR) repeat protein [Arcticibacterium sp.]|jgi:tetratricopeptide (TPR) repeat protein
MKNLYIIIMILTSGSSVFSQDRELAAEYFNQGEYEKAVEIYEKLSKRKENSLAIHDNYSSALIRLKEYEKARKFLIQEVKNYPDIITYRADLAYLLEISNKMEDAEEAYRELIKEAASKDNYIYQLQNFFYKTNKMEMLIDMLLLSRERSKDVSRHNTLLARAYLFAGKKKEMLEEVLSYGVDHANTDYVERTVLDNIKEDKEIEMFERLIYTKIQENPEVRYYNEILIWHFVRQKEFSRAFAQARALDRRLALGGRKVFELAGLAYENKAYREAARMYQFVMDEYPNGDFYTYSRRWNIQSREQMVKSTFPINELEIAELINQYQELIVDVGLTPKTIDALRNMALLYAFYLNDQDKAVGVLERAIAAGGSDSKFKDQCKLDLGDIYILKEEPWEATLLYMQVEKTQKEDYLGEIAKLKNAKLHYFTGEFDLAKDILDILKKATTREIANDAMQLSLLIQDNLGLDTTDAAISAYADVELLLFQNKIDFALKRLDSLFVTYKSHSLADEILWLRANTNFKLNNVEATIFDLESILKNYKYDILADDALFMLATIYDQKLKDKSKAMSLYRQMLQDFPGSIFGAESRKKFRDLRGDFVY